MEPLKGCVGRVCVNELWYLVNVPPPAPTRTWTLNNRRRTAGFHVSNHLYWRVSYQSLTFTALFSFVFFCFICTITFLVFVWSRTEKGENEFQTILFVKVSRLNLFILKRCCTEVPPPPMFFGVFLVFFQSDKQHTSVQPSVVTYRQHSDWQQRTCFESMEWLKKNPKRIKEGVSGSYCAIDSSARKKKHWVTSKINSLLTLEDVLSYRVVFKMVFSLHCNF